MNVSYGILFHLGHEHLGFWEAGIKRCKSNLKKVIAHSVLTIQDFYTVFCQVESILNSPAFALSPKIPKI